MFNTGTAQIDVQLSVMLVAAGVPEEDARELARTDAFGGTAPTQWVQGLRGIAAILNHGNSNLDWSVMPEPWGNLGPALVSANGSADKVLIEELTPWNGPVQNALLNAIGHIAAQQAQQASGAHHTRIDGAISAARQTNTASILQYLTPIDVDLWRRVRLLLERRGQPKDRLRKEAGEQVIEWLAEHGEFVQTVYGRRYYLWRDKRRLLALDTDLWKAWLYQVSGVNPASPDYRYINADCQAASFEGRQVNVCRISHWDGAFLRVSRFDGMVYRLDGQTMEVEGNGDGPAIFDDPLGWSTVTPDFSSSGDTLDWWASVPNFSHAETSQLALTCWLIASFFSELCPTRPLLMLLGEAGSGKSLGLRLMLKLIAGPIGELSGIPDKPDGFTAAAANLHHLVLDNLDDPADWLRDKLARISTGGVDNYRVLYSNNELGTVAYRCWVAVTSRTPDTLKRDDLADRLLILPVNRLSDSARIRESAFLAEALSRRSLWWGDVLTLLNHVVSVIRQEGLPEHSAVRMADFEVLGRVVAQAKDAEQIWLRAISDWGEAQSDLLLDDSVIVEAIEEWLKTPTNYGRKVDTRTLYSESELALYGSNRPDGSWPRSIRSYGWQLRALRRALKRSLNVSWEERNKRTYYLFTH